MSEEREHILKSRTSRTVFFKWKQTSWVGQVRAQLSYQQRPCTKRGFSPVSIARSLVRLFARVVQVCFSSCPCFGTMWDLVQGLTNLWALILPVQVLPIQDPGPRGYLFQIPELHHGRCEGHHQGCLPSTKVNDSKRSLCWRSSSAMKMVDTLHVQGLSCRSLGKWTNNYYSGCRCCQFSFWGWGVEDSDAHFKD